MVITVALIFGLIIGSALNSIVWRLHAGKSWLTGRSICPHCEHVLGPLDLVPVLSWVMLRGRCRYCHKPIGWQYPLVELATAVLFGWSVAVLSPISWQQWLLVGIWLLVVCLFVLLAVYDLRWLLLPDKLTVPLAVAALVLLGAEAWFGLSGRGIEGPILAALLAAAGFWSLAAITRGRGMGGGDIKLVAGIGLLLGLQKTAAALVIAFVSAAVIGLVLLGLKLKSRRDPIPFGPFLIAGTIIAYLAGGPLIAWYLRLAGLGA